jgi:hypothetical protein
MLNSGITLSVISNLHSAQVFVSCIFFLKNQENICEKKNLRATFAKKNCLFDKYPIVRFLCFFRMSKTLVNGAEKSEVSQEWIDKITRELAEHVDDRNCIAIHVSSSAEVSALRNIVAKYDYFIEFWSKDNNGQQYAVIDTHSINIPFDAFD